MARFNEGAFEQLLLEVLGSVEAAEVLEEVLGAQAEISAVSFREAGVLTNNAGLVVRVGRREFQLTVVESTPSYLREDDEEAEDPEACPGCGCRPGDGRTEGCHHPDGCGFWEKEEGDG